ncbi:hypothetical protein DWY59_00045 [Ruminococcus bromii]|jgi:hypothetical protein|nr:hypothetical protein DWY59_00045 [Ruminococcus bromii]
MHKLTCCYKEKLAIVGSAYNNVEIRIFKLLFNIGPASFVVSLPKRKPFNDSTTDEEVVMNLLNDKKFIYRKDVESILNCSKFKAISIINTLIEKGVIKKTGTGRTIQYTTV